MKIQVAELEIVNRIINHQLDVARTELATVLLRMSLSEAEPDVDTPMDESGDPPAV